jgi:formamidopyrimidine-DNA glycosylase
MINKTWIPNVCNSDYLKYMPELPEVETVRRELAEKLKDRKIVSIEIFHPKLIGVGPETLSQKRVANKQNVEKFITTLKDKKFINADRRGKILILSFSGDLNILVHLKMTGQFIFETPEDAKKTGSKYRLLNKQSAPLVQLPCKHTQALFRFKDKSVLYFNDVRKFAYLKLVLKEELPSVKELQEYGPEPLEKSFNLEVFSNNLKRKSKSSIKLALLEPRVVVGVGNIYSDEILFFAGVRPDRLVGTLSDKEIKSIFEHIPKVLLKGIETKGSSVGDFIRTDGSWGTMGKHHFVYGRKKDDCLNCHTALKTIKLGGRSSTFCPNCQK